jgi:hypothetical protein
MTKIGERIGAIQKADQTAVWFFGYGVYAGDEVPPSGFLHDLDRPNPKLQLDNGDVVWGYESWWGPEDQIKEVIGDRQVIIVEPER